MSMLTTQGNINNRTLPQPLRLKSNRSARSLREGPTAPSIPPLPIENMGTFMRKMQNHVRKNVAGSRDNSRTGYGQDRPDLSVFESHPSLLPAPTYKG